MRKRGPSSHRSLVLSIVQGSKDHPTADQVFQEARRTAPTLSLATVYRNLSALVAAGEVRERAFDGVSHFDPCTEPHAHLVCGRCGRIADFAPAQGLLTRSFREAVGEWEVAEVDLEVRGLCPLCRSAGVDSRPG